ncbi:MAG: hypothetical protein ABWU84_07785 [Pyrobaculum sp.]|uniref:hypothetical protein n=1 Tax=Pyrobaculum sp. TaxID=2004705 RepID=UPI003EE991D0
MKALLLTILAVYALAQLVMYHPPYVRLADLVLANATHFYDPSDQRYYWTGLTLVGDAGQAYYILQTVCRYTALDLNETVYCSKDGESWIEARALALFYPLWRSDAKIFPANFTAETPLGPVSGALPAGWYSYGGQVFRLPNQIDFVAQLVQLREELSKASQAAEELGKKYSACATKLNETLKSYDALNSEVAQLRAELDAYASARSEAESKAALMQYIAMALAAGLAALVAYLIYLKRQSI